jgi:uncharacterized protein
MRLRMVGFAAALAIACLAAPMPTKLAVAGGTGPSFDCAKATLPDEKAICADPQLSAMDRLIADAYRNFEPAYGGDKKTIARGLVADRKRCGSDTACIAAVLSNALDTYGGTQPWVEQYMEGLIGKKALDVAAEAPKDANQPMPAHVGECAVTHITELTTRFGEGPLAQADNDAGSLVTFANQGVQVSYDHEYGLASSQVGDAAALCLVSIPRDCPEGDERGRTYYGIDLLLHGTWVLPDSQHMCGGA